MKIVRFTEDVITTSGFNSAECECYIQGALGDQDMADECL